MKKLLAALFLAGAINLSVSSGFATDFATVKDIPADFWAKKEIECVITNDILKTNEEGNFNPEQSLTRVEFVQALLKLLSNDNLNVNIKNSFSDIKETDSYYNDILRSEQLGLVYGYPDNTFQPNKAMLRSETTSVISHITKDKFLDCSILDKYTDRKEVEEWARIPYAKSIDYGIYVNYPDENKLEPNRELTKAEAAVLLARLKDRLAVVKPQFKGPQEINLSMEHINNGRAADHKVRITNLRRIIYEGNVLVMNYDSRFESKKHAEGDEIIFVFPKNVCTDEGSLIIPANSKLISEVGIIKAPKKLSKNAKVYLNYKQLVLPNGKTYEINAKTNTRDASLTESWWIRYGKAATVVGLFTPGLNYRTRCGEKVKIKLNEDLKLDYIQ